LHTQESAAELPEQLTTAESPASMVICDPGGRTMVLAFAMQAIVKTIKNVVIDAFIKSPWLQMNLTHDTQLRLGIQGEVLTGRATRIRKTP
jgi:hypothetical protein